MADFSNWSNVVVASLFFAAFGFGGESSAALRKVGQMVRRPQMNTGSLEGAERPTEGKTSRHVGVSPRKRIRAHDSFP